MSVQTEITRIAQAKTDIKNIVNSKVANTITNQTIDAFPPLIDSSIAAYKNLIPWIEGSGSSFTIDNAEADKLDKFEIEGNTIQGKLPSEYTQVDYIESNGAQYIDTGINADNNLRVILDMAYTSPTLANQNIGAINTNSSPYSRYHILPGDYFKIYLNNSGYNTINSDTERHLFDINPSGGNVIVDNQSFTIPSNISDTGLNFWLFGRNSTGAIYYSKIKQWGCKMYYSNILVRDFIPCYRNSDNKVGLYDIVNGVFYINSRQQESSTDFTYGTLAPTPDVPVEIEMVNSKNTINVSGTNLIGFDDLAETTQNGVTYSIKDNVFTLNGTASAFVGGININQWKLKKAGNYTLKIEKISGEWTKGIIGISLRDSSNSQLNYHQVAYNTSGGSVTREDNQNVIDNVVKETFFINKDSVFNNFKFRMIFNEGSTAQDYEPYHNKDYEIDLHGKNLFDKDNIVDGYVNNGGGITSLSGYKSTGDYIEIKPNTQYYKSISGSTRWKYFDENKNVYSNNNYDLDNATREQIFTTPPNVKYLKFTLSDDKVDNFILAESPTPTEYEEFYDYKLCEIGDYKDVIFKNNQLSSYYDNTLDEDGWYIKRNALYVNGIDLGWRKGGGQSYSDSTIFYDTSKIASNISVFNILCTHLKYANIYTSNSMGIAIFSSNEIGIRMLNTIASTVDELNNWLINNDVKILLPLATPTYEKITNETLISQLEAIETETGTNIFEVSNDNDVLPNLYVLTEKQDSYNNWKKREGIN